MTASTDLISQSNTFTARTSATTVARRTTVGTLKAAGLEVFSLGATNGGGNRYTGARIRLVSTGANNATYTADIYVGNVVPFAPGKRADDFYRHDDTVLITTKLSSLTFTLANVQSTVVGSYTGDTVRLADTVTPVNTSAMTQIVSAFAAQVAAYSPGDDCTEGEASVVFSDLGGASHLIIDVYGATATALPIVELLSN